MTKYLKNYYNVTDVGLVRLAGLPRHGRHDREAEDVTKDLRRVLHDIYRKLADLTCHVPMLAVEYVPKDIQRRVVGAPCDCVRLFGSVATTIVFLPTCIDF